MSRPHTYPTVIPEGSPLFRLGLSQQLSLTINLASGQKRWLQIGSMSNRVSSEPAGPSDLRPRLPHVIVPGTHITISEIDTHSVFSEIDTDTLFSEFDADSLFSEMDVDAVFSEFEDDTTFSETDAGAMFSKTLTIASNTMPTTSTPASDIQDTQTNKSMLSHFRTQLNSWLQVNGGTARLNWRVIKDGPEDAPTWTVVGLSESLCEPQSRYHAEPAP